MWLRRLRRGRTSRKPRSLYGNLIEFQRARLRERPNDTALRLALVRHLQMARRYDEAVEELRYLLDLEPGHRRAKALLLRLRVEQRLASRFPRR